MHCADLDFNFESDLPIVWLRFASVYEPGQIFIAMTTTPTISEPLTFTYKLVDDLRLLIDVYPPSVSAGLVPNGSAVIYFHGGGLTVGNRRSWFPSWLQREHLRKRYPTIWFISVKSWCTERLSSVGVVFISADYRLVCPSTGHDVLQDIKDLFAFLGHNLNQKIEEGCIARGIAVFHIDATAIAVSGTSSGGLCAYLAAMHATPKPVAVLSMYGMGGDYLVRLLYAIFRYESRNLFRLLIICNPRPNRSFAAGKYSLQSHSRNTFILNVKASLPLQIHH